MISTLDEKIFDEINAKIDSTKIQVNVEFDETLVVSTNICLSCMLLFQYQGCSCVDVELLRPD